MDLKPVARPCMRLPMILVAIVLLFPTVGNTCALLSKYVDRLFAKERNDCACRSEQKIRHQEIRGDL